MKTDTLLMYADRAGRFYARQYGISPMAGRLLGYLIVCEPQQQSINQLAEALMASRSAITGAVQVLENLNRINRVRVAGNRSDLISLDLDGFEANGFDAAVYQAQAELFSEGRDMLSKVSRRRQQQLEDLTNFANFLAEHMPRLQQQWHVRRAALRANRQ